MAETVMAPAAAFEELERLVRHLGDELAFFRRRAMEAERRLKELGVHAGHAPSAEDGVDAESLPALRADVARLAAENADLRARAAEAAARTQGLAERVRFLRQQQEGDGEQ